MRIRMVGTYGALAFLGIEVWRASFFFWAPYLDLEKIDRVLELPGSWPETDIFLSWSRNRDGTGRAAIWTWNLGPKKRYLEEAEVPRSLLPSQSGTLPLEREMGIEEALARAREQALVLDQALAQIPLFPSRPKAMAKRLLTRKEILVPLKLAQDPDLGLDLLPRPLDGKWIRDWIRYRDWEGKKVVGPLLEALFGEKGLRALKEVQEELWVKKVLES